MRITVDISLPPEVRDHRYLGRAVLPAVLALDQLARVVERHSPQSDPAMAMRAELLRFLTLPEGVEVLPAAVDLDGRPGGGVAAALLTMSKVGVTSITRAREHVRVSFARRGKTKAAPGGPGVEPFSGKSFELAAEDLYRDMVPFGPGFQNVRGPVRIGDRWAEAQVVAEPWASWDSRLGSPLPLDAALHVACAWGQRHAGAVTFPVGFASRRVLRPTRPGEICTARVVALTPRKPVPGDPLTFRIVILGDDGAPKEVLEEVRMEDVSRGEMQVPAWVRA